MAATDTYNPRWLPQKLTIQDGGHRYLQSKMVATETYKMADTDTYNPRWLPQKLTRWLPQKLSRYLPQILTIQDGCHRYLQSKMAAQQGAENDTDGDQTGQHHEFFLNHVQIHHVPLLTITWNFI